MRIGTASIVFVLAVGLAACSPGAPESTGSAASAAPASPAPAQAVNRDGNAMTPATPSSDDVAPVPTPIAPPSSSVAGADDAAAPPGFDGTSIPARFHGVYAAEGRCGQMGDESRLVVSAGAVQFHESRGSVVQSRGDGDALALTLALTGEGEAREAAYAFRREADGRRLVDTRNGMVRLRCEDKAPG